MIRKLVTGKGLPVNSDGSPAFTSLPEADAWREEHAPPRKSAKASEKNGTEVGEKNARISDTTSGGTDNQEQDAESAAGIPAAGEPGSATFAGKRQRAPVGTLPLIDVEKFIRTDKDFDSLMIEHAERVPQIAFGLLELKQKTGVPTAIAAATENWGQSVKAAAAVRERFLDLQERTRALIQLDAVMDIVGTELQALRSHLDKLGDKIGALANPENPTLAAGVINTAVDRIYELMEQVEAAARKEFGE